MRNRSHRQEVKTIAEYITTETIMPPFPAENGLATNGEAALCAAALSQKNGWQDSEGRTYIVYPITEIAEILDKSTMTIQSTLNDLDAAGLLERERRGFSALNRLYVKVPEVVKVSLPMTQRNLDVSHKENCTSDLKETLPMTSRKLYPNQININKLKENQRMGVSGEPPAPYGKYQNVFLTESEYAELKQEYPDSLERRYNAL